MKLIWTSGILLMACTLSIAGRVQAQSVDLSRPDSVQAKASEVLDQVGSDPTLSDPQSVDDLLDYIEFAGRSDRYSSRLESAHLDLNTSWVEARHERSVDSARSSKLHFRSKAGGAFDAYSLSGYASNAFLGSPYSYENRAIGTIPGASLAIAQRKYSWEPLFTEHLAGFAELSERLSIINNVAITGAVAGNYNLAIANGLLFGTGASASRATSAASAVEERSYGFRGTLSNGPSTLMGGAIRIGSGVLDVMAFGGRQSLDARVQNDTIQSIVSGMHYTTASQITLKNNAVRTVDGLRLALHNADTSKIYALLGATAAQTNYDHSYNGGSFGGEVRNTTLGSIDGLVVGPKWDWSGEVAASKTTVRSGYAINTSLLLAPIENTAVSLGYHTIPGDFYSPFGAIQGNSNGLTRNTTGYYLGVQSSPLSGLQISSYVNLPTGVDSHIGATTHGDDLFAGVTYSLHEPKMSFAVSVRSKHGESLAVSPDSTVIGYVTLAKDQLSERYEMSFAPISSIETKARYEHHSSGNGSGFGDALKFSASISSARGSMFGVTVTRFSVNAFQSAIYDYESTLPGSGSFAVLSGKGTRLLLRSSARILHLFRLSLFVGGSIYDDDHNFGSGVTARSGKSDLSGALQIDFGI